MRIGSFRGCLALLGAMLALASGCGEESKPGPGYADPCLTSMGPVLGCSATNHAVPSLASAIAEACEKLVNCGILSAEFLGNVGEQCSTSSDCKGGTCLTTEHGESRCHFPWLDYQWCIERLSTSEHYLCDSSQEFSPEEVGTIVDCIEETPCPALGLPFADKRRSSSQRPDLDKFSCNSEKDTWTATVCDQGMLSY